MLCGNLRADAKSNRERITRHGTWERRHLAFPGDRRDGFGNADPLHGRFYGPGAQGQYSFPQFAPLLPIGAPAKLDLPLALKANAFLLCRSYRRRLESGPKQISILSLENAFQATPHPFGNRRRYGISNGVIAQAINPIRLTCIEIPR